LGIIKKGCKSTVYSGCNTQTNKPLAFKLINLSKLPDVVKRETQQEIHILQKFDQLSCTPNLIDLIQRGNEICLVMDLIKGKKLYYLLEKYPKGIPISLASVLFYEILSAVNEIHKNGICHRNITIDHIIFDSQSKSIKILDFSLAKETRKICNGFSVPIFQHDVVGSLYNTPPEMLKNNSYDGSKVDIWSLGILFYKLLFNRNPFGDNLSLDELTNIKLSSDSFNIYFPQTIDVNLKNLIKSMLQYDPSERSTAYDLMQHKLFRNKKSYL